MQQDNHAVVYVVKPESGSRAETELHISPSATKIVDTLDRVRSSQGGGLMVGIDYDNGSAARLERAATTAAQRLRAQAAARRTAAESAREDFDGAYAKRFDESARIESEDRPNSPVSSTN